MTPPTLSRHTSIILAIFAIATETFRTRTRYALVRVIAAVSEGRLSYGGWVLMVRTHGLRAFFSTSIPASVRLVTLPWLAFVEMGFRSSGVVRDLHPNTRDGHDASKGRARQTTQLPGIPIEARAVSTSCRITE